MTLRPNPAHPASQGISVGNSAQQMPACAYVGNQPLSATDPTGLLEFAFQPRYVSLMTLDAWMGSGCQIDGIDAACGMAYALVSSPLRAATLCPAGGCPPGSSYPNSGFNQIYAPEFHRELWMNCEGASLDSYGCLWSRWSQQFVANGSDPYLAGDALALYTLRLAGQESYFLTQPQFYAEWEGASLAGGLALNAGGVAAAASAAWGQLNVDAASLESSGAAFQDLLRFLQGAVPGGTITPTWGGAAALGYKIGEQAARCPPWEGACW